MMLDVWSWAAVVQCSWRGAEVQGGLRGASRPMEKRAEILQGYCRAPPFGELFFVQCSLFGTFCT